MAFGQHASQFVADPLTGDLMNLRGKFPNCLKRHWVNLIFETRRESHCPQHPQLVFAEPQLGIADSADNAGVQIVFAADEIQNFVGERIKQQPIDGEIATLHILLRIAAEANLIWMAPIAVSHIAAKSRNFNTEFMLVATEGMLFSVCLLAFSHCGALRLRKRHQHNPELRPDGVGFRKNAHDVIRSSIGRNVVVGRLALQQQIANASAHQICLMTLIAQRSNNRNGEAL